jgi:toxoflavin biosynthesis protein ToxD
MSMNLDQLLPSFVEVPAVPFLIGTPERSLSALAKTYGGTRESYREEAPRHTFALPAFAIAQIPVTNALYAVFVAASGARPPITWRAAQPPAALLAHPVVDVSWLDARAFCTWLNGAVGQSYRLPSEAEWEHAARGVDGRAFPWGNEWDAARANTRERGLNSTTPAGNHASASPYDCLDMAGNVWEWTASLDVRYPYRSDDGREEPQAPGRRILRGGCYANPQGFARCACRFRLAPPVRNEFLGFRLARG